MASTRNHRLIGFARALADCEPGKPARKNSCALNKHRPLWLLPRPQRLSSRASRPWFDGEVSLIAGPERIASGWWDEADDPDHHDSTRDYFVARTADGETLWIYRHPSADNWYLHGIFS